MLRRGSDASGWCWESGGLTQASTKNLNLSITSLLVITELALQNSRGKNMGDSQNWLSESHWPSSTDVMDKKM